MSSSTWLNLLSLSLSIFNVIILLWLSLTILLNAERRVWGLWVSGGGLMLATAFFVSHTIILHRGLIYPDWRFPFWWKVGFLPTHLLPYAWYIVMLWYGGYWENESSAMQSRQRPWFWITTAGMLAGVVFLLFLPNTIFPTTPRLNDDTVYVTRIPELLVFLACGYGLYIILCLLLSLDAVMHPGRTARLMGEIARQRAQPWLVATTIALLFVTMVIASLILIWVLFLQQYRVLVNIKALLNILAEFDLIILICLTIAISCLGQAAVTYEVFTGKPLPRGGLNLQWKRLLVLGSIYSLIVSAFVTYEFPPLHGILALTIGAITFMAMFNREAYQNHERTINSLRPFITSQRLYDNFLGDTPTSGDDLQPAFFALCRDVIGAEVAYLLPLGPLATLVSDPLVYPHNRTPPPIAGLPELFSSPQASSHPISPKDYSGANWALPLWNERGLIGLFLLGEKIDGQLYTEEEMGIARTSGERLIDTQASAEMARRLIDLQRQKMAESQLIDQRTRRVLHDDVLPQLHTALLALSPTAESQEAMGLITTAHKQISELLRQMPTTAAEPIHKGGLVHALHRVIEYEMPHQFDSVSWEIDPIFEKNVADISPLTAEVVYYAAREALRNSAKHGRGPQNSHRLNLIMTLKWNEGLNLSILDDGVGVQAPSVSAQRGGAGQGLQLHTTMLAVVGGQLTLESQPDQGTHVDIYVPAASFFLRQ